MKNKPRRLSDYKITLGIAFVMSSLALTTSGTYFTKSYKVNTSQILYNKEGQKHPYEIMKLTGYLLTIPAGIFISRGIEARKRREDDESRMD